MQIPSFAFQHHLISFFIILFFQMISKTLTSQNIIPQNFQDYLETSYPFLPEGLRYQKCDLLPQKLGVLILRYNTQMGKFSNWSKQEDEILIAMIATAKSKKWIKTSQKLKEKKYLRSPSECRERYINYLAPDIDKSQITQQELQIIYERYQELGPKWSMIQQYLKCKTQCKIKNVFYGNIKNLLKTVYKFFTLKTAPFINTISTDFLQVIYDGCLEFDGMRQTRQGIKAMRYRNNKAALLRHILTDKEGYLQLINTVLKEIFNRGPLECRFDDNHARRIKQLLDLDRSSGETPHKSSKNMVKYEDSSDQGILQVDEEASFSRQDADRRQEMGSEVVKQQTDDAVVVKVQSPYTLEKKTTDSSEDAMIYPFQNANNNETEFYMNPYLMQGYFQYPFYYLPPHA